MTIKKLRQKDCLSQDQLAEATGLSLRTIQRAESGQRVSNASLKTLADFFEIDAEDLREQAPRISLAEIAGVHAMQNMTRHRAIQLILFVVTFFVCCFQWLAYYAYLNPSPADASLAYILGILAQIAAAAAVFAVLFSFARITFVRTYYSVFIVFIAGSIILDFRAENWSDSASYALVFPVFFSLMLLAQMLIHILQLALSLKGESTVMLQTKLG